MTNPRTHPDRDSHLRRRQPRFGQLPIASTTAHEARGVDAHERRAGTVGRVSGSGLKRLDPEAVVAHLGYMMRAAGALCGSRESAEDLVQETVARVLSRPRLLRGEDERGYLMQALRNTFATSMRTAGRRPRVVTTIEELDPAERRTAAGPEEAVITAEVFPAIARLPDSFRRALVAVDIAGLSYREAARALGAPQATITTRLYRARQRVARELDPERFGLGQSNGTSETLRQPATAPPPRRAERPHASRPQR
jgi:RNA polymerase sigma-70 factor, ECF subfamily